MYILGINAAFHDSSACLLYNGKLVAAAEEERFTHIKHGKRPVPFTVYELPFHAVSYCLSVAGIHLSEVDHVAYSFDPAAMGTDSSGITLPDGTTVKGGQEWEPLFRSYILHAPRQLVDGYPLHLQSHFYGATVNDFQWHYINHHLSHAASAFYPSPFNRAAVLVLDGRGEKVSTSSYRGKATELEKLDEVLLPSSLGLLYEDITAHLGFLRSSDEYKVMALASFGQPEYISVFRNAFHPGPGGCSYYLDAIPLEAEFGPQRLKGAEMTQKHFNIARSLQDFLQEAVLLLVQRLAVASGEKNLCVAGGVALNCVLNALVEKMGNFEKVWIQPAAGDAGTALGAALALYHRLYEKTQRETMEHCYWGPEFSDASIASFLRWSKLPFRKSDDVAGDTAALLQQDKIVGWFQGRMEFGPRALGARSILASPISTTMQQRLNALKEREDFRPVAPVVLEEDAADWFECGEKSPFMLFVYTIRPEKAAQIPAVAHVDNTARIQTVNSTQNPLYYDLLRAFKQRTGIPILTNTSFNTKSLPIVCTPRDAVECFFSSPLDVLVIGNYILDKTVSFPDGIPHEKEYATADSFS